MALAKILPRGLMLALGRMIGRAIFYGMAGRRKLAIRNVKKGLDCSDEEAKEIAYRSFLHFGMVAVEMMRIIAGGATKEEILSLFGSLDDPLSKLQNASQTYGGKVIYVTAHLGNWEYFGSVMGIVGFPFTVIGRSINNPYIDKMVTKSREAFGSRLVDKEGAMMSLARELKAGRAVGLLPDQKSNDRNSAKIPFLGHMAGTTLGVAKLARRFDAAILPVAVVTDENHSYSLIVDEPIGYTQEESDDDIMLRVNDHLGEMIKHYPTQWFWMHNRWKQ